MYHHILPIGPALVHLDVPHTHKTGVQAFPVGLQHVALLGPLMKD